MGRPTKLTKELTEKICRAVKAGSHPAVAARSVGVGESTYYRWMEEGRAEEKGLRREFYEAVKLAEAEGEVRAVAHLAAAAPTDWRASLALLERRHPHRWLRRPGTVPAAPEERPIVDLSKLSDQQIRHLEEISARLTDPD